jgi:hypothetical protein
MLESIIERFGTSCSGFVCHMSISSWILYLCPCIGSVCLLETLVPDAVKSSARNILAHDAANAESMGETRKNHNLSYLPSHAVDGGPDTAFCTFQGASTFEGAAVVGYIIQPNLW